MIDPDYELFATVAEAGSLSAAARQLRISPAMVSKRLARLEARLGVRLVHRTTRHLSLTPTGQIFHEDVLAILAAIRDAEARLSGSEAGVGGRLRVSAPTSFGRLHVAPHLKDYLEAYPDVELELDLSDEFTDLLAERIDVAIRIAPSIPTGLVAHRLATSRRVLCAAPDYLARHGAPAGIQELHRFRLLAAADQLPWRLEGPDGPIAVHGRSFVRTNSSEVVRELTLAGVGIALRSLWDVGRDIADGRLQRILADYEGSSDVGIYAVHPYSAMPSPAVSTFISHLQGIYAPVAPWEA